MKVPRSILEPLPLLDSTPVRRNCHATGQEEPADSEAPRPVARSLRYQPAMAGHYHNGMDLLTARDAERIYRVTDQLQLHRDWVVVPLNCAEQAFEIVQPDGKLLLRPPGGERFEPWIDGLAARLSTLDLSRTARLGVDDPMQHLTGPYAPRAHGTQRYLERHATLSIGRSDDSRKTP